MRYLVPGPTPCPEVVAISYIRPAEVPTLFSVEGDAQVEQQNTAVGFLTNSERISKKVIDIAAKRLEDQLEISMEASLNKVSLAVESLIANQRTLQETTVVIADASETLQKVAHDIDNSMKETAATSNQLSTTVTSYKEALLSVNNANTQVASLAPNNSRYEDPRLAKDLDHKQRQLLLELSKEYTEGLSVTGLKEKIEAAIKDISPPPPEGTKVQEVNKLRNGGIVIQLTTKGAVKWLRNPSNEAAFKGKLETEAHFIDRTFLILILRVPTTFDPGNQEHLHEIESVNDLPPMTISKVRWIKPVYRRHQNQRFAYATVLLSLAPEANKLIRDGIYVCSLKSYPKRLKYDPKQCMKCCKWGHYAYDCQATTNICGTCGEDHATRDCNNPDKRYCVACRSREHASWDRDCPEFKRKSSHFDEIHPENAPIYFPTDEEWTLVARPERIPLEDRFSN